MKPNSISLFSFSILLSLFLLHIQCSSTSRSEREYASRNSGDEYEESKVSSGVSSSPKSEGKTQENKSPKRMMIYTVVVNLQSKEIEPKVLEIIKLAETFGGYALQYSSQGTIQLKIPQENLKNFLSNLKKESHNYSEDVSAKDVTEDYLDTEIRLENAQKMRSRLLEILKTAKTLEETLKVEAELNKVSESIERWEGKLKYLSQAVQLSTVTVHVRQKWEPVVQKEYQPGPVGYPFYWLYLGLGKVKDGFIWLFIQEVPKEK
ncbi:DUF4349 domain-containing protein [Leptospira levettii]|uniref:DUF4349 domain-containing protein n=1 Tax=Leptospira levettii TaxID=2023178 RepID=UPI00108353E6|nr:DUF4349 domain-containing protein [Leptospira levettii]TGM73492.1 DUF4349 domain-containing protein [Leptospira levettii]TGM93316.1 DUF4349 domain-containing protein [Leptospira levettii]